jgi:hypothetical protein
MKFSTICTVFSKAYFCLVYKISDIRSFRLVPTVGYLHELMKSANPKSFNVCLYAKFESQILHW